LLHHREDDLLMRKQSGIEPEKLEPRYVAPAWAVRRDCRAAGQSRKKAATAQVKPGTSGSALTVSP
jgi:hypothetical protein